MVLPLAHNGMTNRWSNGRLVIPLYGKIFRPNLTFLSWTTKLGSEAIRYRERETEMIIEILVIGAIFLLISRTRISKRGTRTQTVRTISIRFTKQIHFEIVRKVTRTGRITNTVGFVTRRNRRRH